MVPGKHLAADVVQKDMVETVNGQSAKIAMKGDKAMIDDAKIVSTDIKARNGVIHVIDTV